jgi:large subunit ribosomal protein L15
MNKLSNNIDSNLLGCWPKSHWRRKKDRVGRGLGSGMGRRSTRGEKGQLGMNVTPKAYFEGGQTPVYRRLPKKGGNFGHTKAKNLTFVLRANDVLKKMENKLVNIESLKENFKIPFYYKNVKIIGENKEEFNNIENTNYTERVKIKAVKHKSIAEKIFAKKMENRKKDKIEKSIIKAENYKNIKERVRVKKEEKKSNIKDSLMIKNTVKKTLTKKTV